MSIKNKIISIEHSYLDTEYFLLEDNGLEVKISEARALYYIDKYGLKLKENEIDCMSDESDWFFRKEDDE